MASEKYDLNTVKGRLLTFLKEQRIPQTEFCRKLGVAPTYIGVIRKSIPAEKINRIVTLYPELSRDWLLYGEGEMYAPKQGDPRKFLQEAGYLVPLLPVTAFAGNITAWSQSVNANDCEKVVSPVQGVDFAIRISGDSMEPDFHDGSIVLIKRIDDKAFIPWGHPMIVDSSNGVFFKDVYPSEKGKKFIEARSINPKYPPLQIPQDCIHGLYRVVTTLNPYSSY
ncbi:MAG: S24 family peptidase [Muribaculaceae bacterium]|nr:S24 family peptidase [Muribaculaceae bacterium]